MNFDSGAPFCILSISNEFVLFEWVMCVCFVPLHSVMLLLLFYEWDTMPKRNELFNYLQLWRLSSDCFRCCVPFCLVSIKDIVIEIGWNEPSSFKDPPDQSLKSLNSKYRKKSNRWRERERKKHEVKIKFSTQCMKNALQFASEALCHFTTNNAISR